jgi:hypothetical protein
MEDFSKTDSPSISGTPRLHHRISLPDVPEDVEDDVMLHFNDPNWDYQASSSTMSMSTDSVDIHPSTNLSVDMDATTAFDTESQLSSPRKRGSKAGVSFQTIEVQWVLLVRRPFFIFFIHLVLSEIHHTPRSGQLSRTLMIRPWP